MYRPQPSARIWLRIILLFTLLINLISCSPGRKAGKNSLAAPTPSQAPSGQVETDGTVTITSAGYEYQRPLYEPLMAEFHQQNPEITVQFVELNAPPDGSQIIAIQADAIELLYLPSGADSYNYLDLEPLQAVDNTFNQDEFWPGLLGGCRVDGRLIGLPVAANPNFIFYNAAAFDTAGISRPTPGWTWKDFRQAAEALTQRNGDQITRYGFVNTGAPIWLLGPSIAVAQSASGEDLTPSQMEREFGWYIDLTRQGVIATPSLDNPLASENLVSNGQAALWTERIGALADRRNTLSDAIHVAPIPEPSDQPEEKTTWSDPECVAISAGTTHPQETWSWLSFLTRHRVPSRYPLAVPARKVVAEESGYWNSFDVETAATVQYALEHSFFGPFKQLSAINTAFIQALSGEKSLAEVLAPVSTPVEEPTPMPVYTPLPVDTPQTTPTTPDNRTSITYYVDENYNESVEILKPLADAFNLSQTKVFVQLMDYATAFGTGSADQESIIDKFDCFPSSGVTPDDYDNLYPLDPLLEANTDGNVLLADIPVDILSSSRENGTLYGLPIASLQTVIYYNIDQLEKMGQKPPASNWTVDDFWALAASSKSDNVYGFVPVWDYDFLFAAEGVQLFDLTTQPFTAYFDDPKVFHVVETLIDMENNKVIPPIYDGYQNDNMHIRQEMIPRGQAALWTFEGGFRYGQYTDSKGPGYRVGMAPLPLGTGPLAPSEGIISIYISRHAENPNACWQWIRFLSNQPKAFIGIPVRNSVLNSAEYEANVGADVAATYLVVMAQPHREHEPSGYISYPLLNMFRRGLSSTFKGAPPDTMLIELQAKAEAYFRCVETVDPNNWDAIVECAKKADPDYK